MKTIFIIVSLLATSYLLSQTTFVKNAWHQLIKSKQEVSAINKSTQQNRNVSMTEHMKLVNEFKQYEQQAMLENSELKQQFETLSQDIKNIQDELTSQNARHINSEVSNTETVKQLKPQQVDIKKEVHSQTNDPALVNSNSSVLSRDSIINSKNTSLKPSALSEQDKRLQQQAILRSLSQKMELSALRGLSQ